MRKACSAKNGDFHRNCIGPVKLRFAATRDNRCMSRVPAIAPSGMNTALVRLNRAADNIANIRSSPALDTVLVSDMLNLVTAKHEFAANFVVLRTGNEMLGSLLDIRV
jgi:flagellar basal body rod protein FlgC